MEFSTPFDWYKERLVKAYHKKAKQVLGCSQLKEHNHLISPCATCQSAGTKQLSTEQPTLWVLDRVYSLRQDADSLAYAKFCIKAFRQRGIEVQTCLEFPTPKLVYQEVTRIPQIYIPSRKIVVDCFSSVRESEVRNSPGFRRKADSICRLAGVRYSQVLITRRLFECLYGPSLLEQVSNESLVQVIRGLLEPRIEKHLDLDQVLSKAQKKEREAALKEVSAKQAKVRTRNRTASAKSYAKRKFLKVEEFNVPIKEVEAYRARRQDARKEAQEKAKTNAEQSRLFEENLNQKL